MYNINFEMKIFVISVIKHSSGTGDFIDKIEKYKHNVIKIGLHSQ
jgi:hypothetical protein